MKVFYATENSNLRDFTDANYPKGSFCLLQLLKKRDIKVNGARVSQNVALKAGDEVVYYTTPKQEAAETHKTVYEDENILVADKFSGVSTEGLAKELGLRPAHRLDRNTYGLLVFAKTDEAERELLKAFKERTTVKIYHAVCKNNFKESEGELSGYLIKDSAAAQVKIFRSEREAARFGEPLSVRTGYKVLKAATDRALVQVELFTGRTHQIRAHFASVGCPVLGDGKYGDKAFNKKYSAARQQLISKSLQFSFEGGALAYLNDKKFESSFELEI